jgi:UDP-3-O-[3-hydroxymyristoyl] glucosamine N-acyltransferase
MDMTLAEIAQLVGGTVKGDESIRISGLNGLKEAGPGDITFVRSTRYVPLLETTHASAVLIGEEPPNCPVSMVICAMPDLAFAQLLQYCDTEKRRHPAPGIHPTAVIGQNVRIGQDVAIDALVHIADNAVIGDRVVIFSGCYIGHDVTIGDDCLLYPHVVLREDTELGARCILHPGVVLGGDGFGYAPLGGAWVKIPQVGRVRLGDDVEIGCNSTIDRATFGVTRVASGVKIDNLVQIGHNVEIGEHSAMAALVGIAGSAVIGKHVRIGAASGIAGHIEIGDGASVGAKSAVGQSVPAGSTVVGLPAIEFNLSKRVWAGQKRLPELLRRMRELERQVEALENKLHG